MFIVVSPVLAVRLNGLSTRTRIETPNAAYTAARWPFVLMAYPLEQGLKPAGRINTHAHVHGLNGLSTRTRIETCRVGRGVFGSDFVLMAYPLEQGLKPVAQTSSVTARHVLMAYPLEQGLKLVQRERRSI